MKRQFKTEIHKLPACWSAYISYGDWSGMEEEEIKACDEYTEGLEGYLTLSHDTTSEEEEFFCSNPDSGGKAAVCFEYVEMIEVKE